MQVEIITPKRADQSKMIDFGLVALTEAIAQVAPDTLGGGLLGGEFGYGANFENDAFTMRTYYWGDCDCGADEREAEWSAAHKHAPDCYMHKVAGDLLAAGGTRSSFSDTYIERPKAVTYDQWQKTEDATRKKWCKHFGLSYPAGCAIHCTCGHDKLFSAWVNDNGHRPTCALELPNFLHKRTGMEVRWYKWIGRGMESVGVPKDVAAVFRECMESLSA
jgi:hypothetical protein